MNEAEVHSSESVVSRMTAVFDRQIEIPALECLVSAMKGRGESVDLEGAAIAIDANAVLRIPQHRKSSDIIDYLSTQHSGPIILPGQVIQEFWNNQLSAVDTISKGMQRKFDAFKLEVDKYNQSNSDAFQKITEGLTQFNDDNSELFHPDTVRKTLTLLEALSEKAVVPYAPRQAFSLIAAQRKRNKTPPGFRDEGDGDFYVWADILFSLRGLIDGGSTPARLILVTNDGKIDWCREGQAHPILCAEAIALLNLDFHIWTLDKFAAAIN